MKLRALTLAMLILIPASPAVAQTPRGVTLTVPHPPRWDVAGNVAWVGVDKSEITPGDDWSGSAAFGLSGGFYWTPHVKLEAAIASTTWDTVSVQQFVPGGPFRFGEHRFRSDSLSAQLHYQFFENTWFHPFVAAGVEARRESSELTLTEQRSCPPSPCTPLPLAPESSVSYRVRPLVQTGFKGYTSERTFVRTGIQMIFESGGVSTVRGLLGVGADF